MGEDSIFYQEKHLDKVIVDMPDAPIMLDGTQHATEEKLRTFWSTNIYDAIKVFWKFSADIAMQEKNSKVAKSKLERERGT